VEKLRRHAQRFQIEVFHRTLKGGCRMETRQLRNSTRLAAYLAVDLVAVWRLVHLTKPGREAPELPSTACLEEVQWRVLIAAAGLESAAPEQPPPSNRRYGWGRAWAASWGEKAMGRPECNACGAVGSAWRIWSSAGNWRALRPNLEAQCPATGDIGNDQGFAGGL
jgi:hypothetical protein